MCGITWKCCENGMSRVLNGARAPLSASLRSTLITDGQRLIRALRSGGQDVRDPQLRGCSLMPKRNWFTSLFTLTILVICALDASAQVPVRDYRLGHER